VRLNAEVKDVLSCSFSLLSSPSVVSVLHPCFIPDFETLAVFENFHTEILFT
jgi:hypothetical protein